MTSRKLALAAPLLALFGFGPCSRVSLDHAQTDEDGSGSDIPDAAIAVVDSGTTSPIDASIAGVFGPAASPTSADTQCYFTSYPAGSKHCILAPCYIVEPSPVSPTCYGSDDGGNFMGYSDGSAVYLAQWYRATSIVYPDGSATFPACWNYEGGLISAPTGSGAYSATGLTYPSASPTDVATVCDDVTGSGSTFGVVEPTFSTDECYYTSYPVGSKQCVTAPCQMTDVGSGSPLVDDVICTTASSAMYLAGQTLYATSPTGDIQELVPRGTQWFDYCVTGANDMELPTDPGDYYATGLVVGSASGSDLAAFCE